MRNYKLLIMTCSLMIVAACEKASDTVVGVPEVSVECTAASNSNCNASIDGNDVRVIMSRSGCGDEAEFFNPVAVSDGTLTCNSLGCSATLSSWLDASQNSVSEVITGSMDICGLFDLDNNSGESSGDLTDYRSENIQSNSAITLDNWSDFQ